MESASQNGFKNSHGLARTDEIFQYSFLIDFLFRKKVGWMMTSNDQKVFVPLKNYFSLLQSMHLWFKHFLKSLNEHFQLKENLLAHFNANSKDPMNFMVKNWIPSSKSQKKKN